MAVFMANQSGRRLRIIMTQEYKLHPNLVGFARQYNITIEKHTP